MVATIGFTAGVSFTGDWRALRAVLDARRFARDLRYEAAWATYANAREFELMVRTYIQSAVYAPNSNLTVAIKGTDVPLVDHGDLLGAVRVVRALAHGPGAYFVGVENGEPWRSHPDDGNSYSNSRTDGRRMVDIAEIIHDGFSITFTPAVWRAIMVKLAVRGGGVTPHAPGTRAAGAWYGTVRFVPGRPFIRTPFEDPWFRRRCYRRWDAALARALLAQGSPRGTLRADVTYVET